MTRRGSLAYYLAAWVCGSSFMSFALWLEIAFSRSGSLHDLFSEVGLFAIFFFGLIFGVVPSLLFGWLLRRFSNVFHVEQLWIWIAAGAALSYGLMWLLAGLAHLARDPRYLPYSALPIWPFLLTGPAAVAEGNMWVVLPVGAATSSVLFFVDLAFGKKQDGDGATSASGA